MRTRGEVEGTARNYPSANVVRSDAAGLTDADPCCRHGLEFRPPWRGPTLRVLETWLIAADSGQFVTPDDPLGRGVTAGLAAYVAGPEGCINRHADLTGLKRVRRGAPPSGPGTARPDTDGSSAPLPVVWYDRSDMVKGRLRLAFALALGAFSVSALAAQDRPLPDQ